MNTAAALGAARRLSVDVANLSYRLALLEATHDELREAFYFVGLDGDATPRAVPDLWQRRMVGEDAETRVEVILTDVQADAVTKIITALEQLL